MLARAAFVVLASDFFVSGDANGASIEAPSAGEQPASSRSRRAGNVRTAVQADMQPLIASAGHTQHDHHDSHVSTSRNNAGRLHEPTRKGGHTKRAHVLNTEVNTNSTMNSDSHFNTNSDTNADEPISIHLRSRLHHVEVRSDGAALQTERDDASQRVRGHSSLQVVSYT
jgi:hypothetical protein